LGLALCRRYGRAEPAPPGGRQAQDAWPNGENREITRKAVFSEGRGLRARAAGPYQRQGVAFSPDDDARGR